MVISIAGWTPTRWLFLLTGWQAGAKRPSPAARIGTLRQIADAMFASAGALLAMCAVAPAMLAICNTLGASMGATSILLFLAPTSPFSQPKNVIGSQLLASAIGVLASRIPSSWAAPAIAVGATALVMIAAKAVHPPAGATAVLAVADGRWKFVGGVMAGTAILCAAAALWVNIQGLLINPAARWPNSFWCGREEEEKMEVIVVLGREGVRVPDGVELTMDERDVLTGLWERISEKKTAVDEV